MQPTFFILDIHELKTLAELLQKKLLGRPLFFERKTKHKSKVSKITLGEKEH
jgi:hypothetical protein